MSNRVILEELQSFLTDYGLKEDVYCIDKSMDTGVFTVYHIPNPGWGIGRCLRIYDDIKVHMSTFCESNGLLDEFDKSRFYIE